MEKFCSFGYCSSLVSFLDAFWSTFACSSVISNPVLLGFFFFNNMSYYCCLWACYVFTSFFFILDSVERFICIFSWFYFIPFSPLVLIFAQLVLLSFHELTLVYLYFVADFLEAIFLVFLVTFIGYAGLIVFVVSLRNCSLVGLLGLFVLWIYSSWVLLLLITSSFFLLGHASIYVEL